MRLHTVWLLVVVMINDIARLCLEPPEHGVHAVCVCVCVCMAVLMADGCLQPASCLTFMLGTAVVVCGAAHLCAEPLQHGVHAVDGPLCFVLGAHEACERPLYLA